MSDTRVRVETRKDVRLEQLDAEVGGHGLVVVGLGVVVAVAGSPVTEAELANAIEAARTGTVAVVA